MILVLIGLSAFILGFICGLIKMVPAKTKVSVRLEQQEDFKKEYENFLSYDGTEQI